MGYFHTHSISRRAVGQARGVTILELIVSIAIVSLIGVVVLSNQGSFNKSFLLSNTAYDVALSIRDAEVYGTASRGYSGNTAANFGYGIEFSSVPTSHYVLFADSFASAGTGSSGCHSASSTPDTKAGNCVYDAGFDPVITDYTLGNGLKITAFCGYDNTPNLPYCSTRTTTALDITFTRPNTTAIIYARSLAQSIQARNLVKACIMVTTQQGDSRAIVIYATGEVEFLGVNEACPNL